MKRNWIILAIAVVLVSFAVYETISDKQNQAVLPKDTAPKVDYLAPSFELQALDSQIYKVGGAKDKPLFINFWASWCAPCKIELPDLNEIYLKYKDQIDIYGINVTTNDTIADAKSVVQQMQLKFPILIDEQGTALDLYKFQSIPTSFLINREGRIVEIIHLLDSNQLEQKIKSLLDS
ncbi:Thiol-disulfide oxidoreductase ResA [compost metagenome]